MILFAGEDGNDAWQCCRCIAGATGGDDVVAVVALFDDDYDDDGECVLDVGNCCLLLLMSRVCIVSPLKFHIILSHGGLIKI